MKGNKLLRAQYSKGLTLIEILVVLMIMGVIVAGISATLATSRQSQVTITDQNEAQKWAQRAVDAIVDGLRSFTEVQTGQANSVLATQRAKDGTLVRTAKYYVQNGRLLRDRYEAATGQTTTGEWICGNDNVQISNLSFNYYLYPQFSNTPQKINPPAGTSVQSMAASVTIAYGTYQATETSWVKFRNKH